MVDDDLSLKAKIIVPTAIEHHFADGLFGMVYRQLRAKRFIAIFPVVSSTETVR